MRPFKKATLIAALAATSGVALAQSNVQCSLSSSGQLEAALVWRNTLGVERANALCRTAGVRAPTAPPDAATTLSAANLGSNPLEYTPIYSAQTIPQVNVGATSVNEEFVPMFSAR